MTDDAGRKALADRFERGEYGVGSYWGSEFCRNDRATAETVAALRALPVTASREALRRAFHEHIRLVPLDNDPDPRWRVKPESVDAFLDAILALAPVQSATREALIEECAKIAANYYETHEASKAILRANNKVVGENIAKAILALSSVPVDEQSNPDGFKLVYVKRWRTIVKLPEAYANEIVEALRLTPTQPSDRDAVVKGWQPIETAPKDGQHVLIAAKSGLIDIAHWSHGCWGGFIGPNEATHWRPIPAPPSLPPPERKP